MEHLNSQTNYIINYEQNVLNSKTEGTYIITLDQTEVVYCKDGTCNIDYCVEHGIPYAHQSIYSNCGCVVGLKGNIFLNVKRINKQPYLLPMMSMALVKYFREKGLNSVRFINNDVLIDNHKVASGAQINAHGYQYMSYQININSDIELIKAICNKPMVKVPKALKDYAVTTEEMLSFCEDFLSKY
jgi:hypothetical protein